MGSGSNVLASDLAVVGPLGMSNTQNNKGRSQLVGSGQDPSGRQVARNAIVVATQSAARRHQDSVGDALAQAVALSLSYRDHNAENAAQPVRVRGRLSWGNDGHQLVALLDWRQGTVVRACGSTFRLVAETLPDPITGDLPEGAIAEVGACIGYGKIGLRPPTLTDWIVALDPAASAIVRVPPFASSLRVVTQTHDEYTLRWLTDSAAANVLAQIPGDRAEQPYPVPGGANYLQLTNDNAAARNFGLVWILDL